MTDWIQDIVKNNAYEVEQKESKNTELHIIFADENIDLTKLYKLLVSNGFPVLDISKYSEGKNVDLKEGDIVKTESDIVAGKNITMKTQAELYTVDEAILKKGNIGQVVSVSGDTAEVMFNSNIPVTAVTNNGDIQTVAFYIETLKIKGKDLKLL